MMKQNNALRFCDAVWNLSGLFTHDKAVLLYYDLMCQCGIQPAISVHGNIPCRWNSGRIIRSVPEEYQKKCLKEYAKRNIPVYLTFSNYMVTEDELQDTLSNQILELAASYPNAGIISGSDIISGYVRSRYPDMLICTSVLRVVHDRKKGDIDYYNSLAERNDRIVLHPDDGLSADIISKTEPKSKIEVLVNENCVRGCRFREEHCDIVSGYYESRRDRQYLDKLEQFKLTKCQSVQNISALKKFLNGDITTCNMSEAELNTAYQLGCRYFKIQGRSLSDASFLFDVTRYMLTDTAAPVIYKMMMDRIEVSACEKNENMLAPDYENWERI